MLDSVYSELNLIQFDLEFQFDLELIVIYNSKSFYMLIVDTSACLTICL
jgi:hypothetical protein